MVLHRFLSNLLITLFYASHVFEIVSETLQMATDRVVSSAYLKEAQLHTCLANCQNKRTGRGIMETFRFPQFYISADRDTWLTTVVNRNLYHLMHLPCWPLRYNQVPLNNPLNLASSVHINGFLTLTWLSTKNITIRVINPKYMSFQ